MPSHRLDAKGLNCPLPVLRARKAIRALAPGEVLVVEATDPAAPRDFVAFCEASGHALVSSREAAGIYIFEIRRAG